MKRLGILLLGLGFLTIGALTATGAVQETIAFADPLNEMAFFMVLSLMGVGCICVFLATDSKPKATPHEGFYKSSKGFLCSRL